MFARKRHSHRVQLISVHILRVASFRPRNVLHAAFGFWVFIVFVVFFRGQGEAFRGFILIELNVTYLSVISGTKGLGEKSC